jgi:alpha-galactosidase/6-phospho-beta-glucosidase family protein
MYSHRRQHHELHAFETQCQLVQFLANTQLWENKQFWYPSDACDVIEVLWTDSKHHVTQALRSDGVTIPKSAIVESTIVVEMWG